MARITKAKLKAVVAEAGKAIPTAKGPSRVSGKTSTVITLLKSKQGATIRIDGGNRLAVALGERLPSWRPAKTPWPRTGLREARR